MPETNLLPPTSLERLTAVVPLDVVDYGVKVVNIPLRSPMFTGFGTIESRPSAVVNIEAVVGSDIREAASEGATLPEPLFTDDYGRNMDTNVRAIFEPLITNGEDRNSHVRRPKTAAAVLDNIRYRFDPDGEKFPTARLAAEIAILGALMGQTSVYDLLGVPEDVTSVAYGKSIGGKQAGELLDKANQALERGSKRIKFKISPDIFHEVVAAILRLDGADMVMVDANGSFDPTDPDHRSMLRVLDNNGLTMIEEPVSRVGQYTGLKAVQVLRDSIPGLRTPICLDDCLRTVADCELSMIKGWADVLNLKPGRLGSFIECLKLARLAKLNDRQVMVGGMLEATPGRSVTLALGAYCAELGFTIPGDLSLPGESLQTDLVRADQLKLNDQGEIALPRQHGNWGIKW